MEATSATRATAQIDCWMDAEHPQTADSLPVTDARVAPLRRALHELNAILHRQPELHALPRTRLRSSWQIGGQSQEALGARHERVWVARSDAGDAQGRDQEGSPHLRRRRRSAGCLSLAPMVVVRFRREGRSACS